MCVNRSLLSEAPQIGRSVPFVAVQREMVGAHLPALRASVLVVGSAWLVAAACRPVLVPIGVLSATLGAVLVVTIVIYRLHPALMLGDDGRWLATRIDSLLRRRVGRLLSRRPVQQAA